MQIQHKGANPKNGAGISAKPMAKTRSHNKNATPFELSRPERLETDHLVAATKAGAGGGHPPPADNKKRDNSAAHRRQT